MAAASYTTDLTTYTDCTTVTGFAEATGMTDTDGTGVADSDLAIHGSVCVSESQRKSGLGSLVYTGTAPTLPTNGAFFVWFKFFAPNTLATKVNGGIRMVVGNSSANYRGWYVNGSNSYAYGGWVNYVVDPTQTALASQTQGSPTTTYATVGIGCSLLNGISKGNSYTIDIIRWGRGETVITNGDLANGYATFNGLSIVNDNPTTGRWGLFQDVGGSYLWKGLMSFGTVGTLTDFRDSNVVITIDNTEFVDSSFNRIEINNASSRVDWDTVLFTALGTASKGELEVIDNADVNFDNCSFSGMNTFIFQSNSTINTTKWRLCELITQGSAIFDNCEFIDSVGAVTMLSNNPENISNCLFESDGSNHGLEINTQGTYSFAGNQFIGYAGTNGSTGNECVYNNSGGLVTLNITSGGDTPTYRNGTASTTVINNNISVTLTGLIDNTEVRVYNTGTQSELAGIENATSGSINDRTFTFSLSAGTIVDIVVHNINYEYIRIENYTIPTSDSSIPIQQRFDRNYYQ